MRRQLSLSVFAAALVAAASGSSPSANAAAQRTFVASYGLTANTAFNCSLAKPCRAFSEAIGVTNPNGEVIVLDSAGYGPVTITKSVSLTAPPGIYAGISVFSGDGVTVNAGASDIVVLRGLSINGQGGNRGIVFQAGARVRIENCVISGMAIAGISHNATSGELIVLDTVVRDNTGGGIVVVGDLPLAVLDHVRSEANGGDGLSVAPTGGSLGVRVTVVDSVFTRNEGNGIGVDAPPGSTATIIVERGVMAYNGQDGFAIVAEVGGAGVATLTRNIVNDNRNNGIDVQGSVFGIASENAMHRNGSVGIFVSGSVPVVWFGGNTSLKSGFVDIRCVPPGEIFTLGTNLSGSVDDPSCVFPVKGV